MHRGRVPRRSQAAMVCLLLLASATPSLVRAGDEKEEAPVATVEETVVVSAHRTPLPTERIGSSVTVIEREEIERREQHFVSELLRTVPGVEVTRTGGPGKASSVRIRGGDASQTLVLVDGLRLNSANTGDVDFAHLTADAVERIEVLRGPQAIYGSEASAGVISIVTRRGRDGLHGGLAAEVGELDLQRWQARADGRRGGFDFALSASDFSTEGVSLLDLDEAPETDPYDNRTYVARLGFEAARWGSFDLQARRFEAANELDGFLDDDPNARSATDGTNVALSWRRLFGSRWQQSLTLGSSRDDLEGSDPDTAFNNFLIESRLDQLYLQTDLAVGDRETVMLGLRSERREGSNRGSFDEQVDLNSGFVQGQWRLRDAQLSATVRYDDHTTFGDETTWRATGSWQVLARTRLRGSVGTTFRAPDFNELFFPGAGDPRLAPETGLGWDLGIERSLVSDRLWLDLTWFDLRWDDLIAFDFTDFRFANVASARSLGVELALRGALSPRARFDFAWTWNDTEDESSGRPLARRPEHRGSLDLYFEPWQRLQGALSVMAVRDRVDSDGASMDDYERIDLTLAWPIGRFRPYVRAENLFDAQYQEVPGFTTPGRVAALGLEVEL